MKFRSFFGNREVGAVAILVALALPLLIGFAGLAIDLGRMYVVKTELQNAADACALAAARELTCEGPAAGCGASFLINAENAGIAVGSRNFVSFQRDAVTVHPSDILFSTVFAPDSSANYTSRSSGASAASKYVMCKLPLTGILPWFMQVMGAGAQTVSSQAVAALAPSQTNCAIPLAMCTQTATPPSYGLTVGKWYSSKFNPGGANDATGNFNWVDFNPGQSTPGCPGNGAQELSCLLQGHGVCSLPSKGTQVGETGAINSLSDAWNSRFGLYKGGGSVKDSDLAAAPPDYTGFAFTPATWPNPPPENAYLGSATAGTAKNFMISRENHTAYVSPPALAGFNSASSTQLASKGADRRLAIAPVVDCAGWKKSQTSPVLAYACILMLNPFKNPGDIVRLEYLGLSSAAGSPCATAGSVGGPTSVGPLVPALVQ